MPFDVKGAPKNTCKYRPGEAAPELYQADCCGEWMVLQEPFQYCVYCGQAIERDPPPKPRSIT